MDITPVHLLTFLGGLGFLWLLWVSLRRLGWGETRGGVLAAYLLLTLVWLGMLIIRESSSWQFLLSGLANFGWMFSSLAFFWVCHQAVQERKPGALVWGAAVLWMIALPAANLSVVILTAFAPISGLVLISGFCVLHAALAGMLFRAQRLPIKPARRNLIKYFAVGWVFTLLADGLYGAGQVGSPDVAAASHLLRLAAAMIYTAALTLAPPPALRQGLRWLFRGVLLALPVIALSTAGLLLLPHAQRIAAPYGFILLALLLGLSLTWLMVVVWSRLSGWINQILPIPYYDPNHILREYSLGISNINTLESLAAVATRQICDAIEIHSGQMYNIEYEAPEKHYHLHRIGGYNSTPPEDAFFTEDSPFVQVLKQAHQPISIFDLDISKDLLHAPTQEREWILLQEMELFVPIYTKDEWIGLLGLGQKTSGTAYQENDLTLIITLAHQTATALQNARLVSSLMRVNNEFRRAYNSLEQSNKQLQQALNQLQQLDQAKTDFISISSHELRTPLTVMRGYNEMLLDDRGIQGNAYHHKMVEGIHAGLIRLEEVVDTMLDMASIDTSTFQLYKEPVSINSLMNNLSERMGEALRERKIELKLINLHELPDIQADNEAIYKVFYQLVANAIKFTPNNGLITVSASLAPARKIALAEGGVEITVADKGIGIKSEDLELIFTKFYQTSNLDLHSSGKVKFKGAGPGLGLAIAKGIVEAHGGRIWAESDGLDEQSLPGSQFHVILPIR